MEYHQLKELLNTNSQSNGLNYSKIFQANFKGNYL